MYVNINFIFFEILIGYFMLIYVIVLKYGGVVREFWYVK